MMAAPPTPRSTASTDRGRRAAKHHIRSRASRTPSPSKPSPQSYRLMNMRRASVFVDDLSELPVAIDKQVRAILGLESWEDRVTVSHDSSLAALAATFWNTSRKYAAKCAENWKSSLNFLVTGLASNANNLTCEMSDHMWIKSLKPSRLVNEFLDEHDSRIGTPHSASAQGPLPDSNLSASFPGPIPSLPYTQSVATTTTAETVDPYPISTPKPDITIGIAQTAFEAQQLRQLDKHQAYGTILSCPNAALSVMRFPFLVVEAKGSSTNGNLVSAQNQAAISGACMLQILQDLNHQAALSLGTNRDLESTPASATPFEVYADVPICLSIVTESPIYELWVHFPKEGGFYMKHLRVWRTTHDRDAQDFVHFLARIMHWGQGSFKDYIVERLKQAPKGGVRGDG